MSDVHEITIQVPGIPEAIAISNAENEDGVVMLFSLDDDSLDLVIGTIKLFGGTEDADRQEPSSVFSHADGFAVMLDKRDAALWLQAEVLNYL